MRGIGTFRTTWESEFSGGAGGSARAWTPAPHTESDEGELGRDEDRYAAPGWVGLTISRLGFAFPVNGYIGHA